MIHLLKILFVFLTFNASYANQNHDRQYLRGGDVVGEGAGLGEANFVYAFLYWPRLTKNCVVSNICKLNQEEKRILFNLQQNHSLEVLNHKLIFKSGKKHPGLFIREGSTEVRVTNSQPSVGSQIYVNTDHLQPLNKRGAPEPIRIEESVLYLLDEFLFHTTDRDFPEVDSLKRKLLLGFSQTIEKKVFRQLPGNNISMTVFNSTSAELDSTDIAHLVLSDEENNYILNSQEFFNPCESGGLGHLRFFSPRWGTRVARGPKGSAQTEAYFHSQLSYSCRDLYGKVYFFTAKMQVNLHFLGLRFVSSSQKFRFFDIKPEE